MILEAYLGRDREAAIDRAILDGYARLPPADLGAEWATRAMIAAEPWDDVRPDRRPLA